MNLRSLFRSIVYKQLVPVDLPEQGSHQHELNGVEAIRDFFGTSETVKGTIRWILLRDDTDPAYEEGEYTFYDARARSAGRTGRSEWRMYYTGEFLGKASAGDAFVLMRTGDDRFFGLLVEQGSAWLRAVTALFDLDEIASELHFLGEEELAEVELAFARRELIDQMGLQALIPMADNVEHIARRVITALDKKGKDFPTTKELGRLARTDVHTDMTRPDDTLVKWLDREEQLFRAIERLRLDVVRPEALAGTTDDFLSLAQSFLNRRKSRMGHALEHHLEELFRLEGLVFTRGGMTEPPNKPDFLFPCEKAYHDTEFTPDLLTMLAAKSTLKDRWRQVLPEAGRIWPKHLCTLDQAVSESMTTAIMRERIILVIPADMQSTYTAAQRAEILSIEAFLSLVRERQKMAGSRVAQCQRNEP